MKEELQSKLVEILGSIQTAAGKAGDFAMTQLPDIAQQYVMYGRAYTVAIAFAAVLLCLIGLYWAACVRARHEEASVRFKEDHAAYEKDRKEMAGKGQDIYQNEPYRHWYFEASDLGPVPYLPIAAGVVLFGLNLSQTLLVWFAPKVWLLKEIASLVR